jgi:hypothetical protein
MMFILIWSITEAIHFTAGFVGCLCLPNTVMKAYTLFPKVAPNQKAYEMIHVVTMYYLAFIVMAVRSALNEAEAYNFPPMVLDFAAYHFAAMLIAFYGGLFLRDISDIIKIGYTSNPGRYADTAVHVIGGLVALYVLFHEPSSLSG